MLRTVEMAVADARARGIEVEVRAVDDREDESAAARAAADLVSDPSVIAVIGHKNSGPSGAAGPIYAAAGLAQVTQCSTDNALSHAGWPTFFRLCADNERQAAVAAEFAYSRLRPATSAHAVAVHDGTDYGRPLSGRVRRDALLCGRVLRRRHGDRSGAGGRGDHPQRGS